MNVDQFCQYVSVADVDFEVPEGYRIVDMIQDEILLERVEPMTNIEELEQAIKAARKALPYADGRAYYETLDEIREMEKKLEELKDAR